MVDHDRYSLCSCIITSFPILDDRIERLRIRESNKYLGSTTGRSASHPKFNCYAIVL